jgi:cell division protein FtsB
VKPVWRWALAYLVFLAGNVIYGYYQQTQRQQLGRLEQTNQRLRQEALALEVQLTQLEWEQP